MISAGDGEVEQRRRRRRHANRIRRRERERGHQQSAIDLLAGELFAHTASSSSPSPSGKRLSDSPPAARHRVSSSRLRPTSSPSPLVVWLWAASYMCQVSSICGDYENERRRCLSPENLCDGFPAASVADPIPDDQGRGLAGSP